VRLAQKFQGQTVKGQGYRRAGHTTSVELGGHTACFTRIHRCELLRLGCPTESPNRPITVCKELYWRKTRNVDKTRNTSCRTRSLPMQLFHLEQAQRDVHPVQNLLLCTKFHRASFKRSLQRVNLNEFFKCLQIF